VENGLLLLGHSFPLLDRENGPLDDAQLLSARAKLLTASAVVVVASEKALSSFLRRNRAGSRL
jgi:hypothetical protein